MANYHRGRSFEQRVKEYLQSLGYYVMRSASSKGIADLFAAKRGKGFLLQCAYSSASVCGKWGEVAGLARKTGLPMFMVTRDDDRSIIFMRVYGSGNLGAVWCDRPYGRNIA